jgi:hypothetical protein
MKITAIALVLLASATPAFADEAIGAIAAPPPKTLGVDAMAVMPVGDYGDAATIGLGVLGRIEVPAGSGFVTGRAGVIFHQMNTSADASLTLIPLYAGYRLPVGTSGAYVAGELGLTIGYASVSTPFGSMSDSDSEIGMSLMAGMRRGALDFRAGLFAPDLDDLLGFVASAGYDFAAF